MESAENNLKDPSVTKKLAVGVLEIYEPPLVTVRAHLNELIDKQKEVGTQLSGECKKMEQLVADADLQAMMTQIARDSERLVAISNNFSSLQKHVETLKQRAERVQKVAEERKAKR